MDEIINKPGCIQTTLRIMGDKWTPLLLRELANGALTFSALETALQPISPRTLSQRLDMLEHEKIVEKRQYCEHPPRFKYILSSKGTELQEVLIKMAEWGEKYQSPMPLCDPNAQVRQPGPAAR
jgi:DNA-binding HxlR family transcriptional regulator